MSFRRRASAIILWGLAMMAAGCERKPPQKLGGLPPLTDSDKAAAVHPPSGMGTMPANHPQMPANHPGMPTAVGDAEQATPGGIAFDAKTVIAGQLRVADKIKDKVKDGDVIFIVVRSADQPGPPLAVRKIVASTFPMLFSIDGRDAMMAGTKMSGRVTVSVRVDKDGDAISKNPGDVTGVSAPVVPPTDKLVVTLDTVL
jgi:cytochrome c-type biogenesis protein CcmH